MRRRRRDDDSESSLELLLDTMCNAFGGIIFIAMLLSVLSLTGSAARKTASVSEVVEDPAARQLEEMSVQAEVEELNAEIEKAKETTEQQKKNIALLVKKEADRPLLARLASLKVDADRMDEEFRRILQLMTAEEAEWEKALRENPDLSGEIKAKEEELRKAKDELNNTVAAKEKEREKVEEKLEAEKKKRQRKVKLPRIRRSDREPFDVMLSGGKVYLVDDEVYNEDVKGTKYPGRTEFRVKPNQGQPLRPGAEKYGRLFRLLNKDERWKKEWYIRITVYPDSYEEFHALRDLLLKRDFGYNCVILKKNVPLTLVYGIDFYEQ